LVSDDVYETTNILPQHEIENIWNLCIANVDADMSSIISLTNKLKEFGYPISNILEQLKSKVTTSVKLSDTKKSLIVIQIGVTERRLIEGADEHIQLLNIICYTKGVISNIINYYPASIC
jgi:replication factor C subunit 2/4